MWRKNCGEAEQKTELIVGPKHLLTCSSGNGNEDEDQEEAEKEGEEEEEGLLEWNGKRGGGDGGRERCISVEGGGGERL